MPCLDQSQSKKARGTRWLEIKSVNLWCDRPRFFHFRIGLRHLLHISRKSHMLHGMISIQVSHSIYDWIKALSCNEEQFWYVIEKNTCHFYKMLHPRRCAIMGLNGAGTLGWFWSDCSIMWLVYMDLVKPVSYIFKHANTQFTHL